MRLNQASLLLVACVLVLVCTATCEWAEFFNRVSPPRNWIRHERAPSHLPVPVSIGLQQENLDYLDKLFWAVSDPTSPMYQQYPNATELLQRIAPSEENALRVQKWIRSVGVEKIDTSAVDTYRFVCTVKQAEELFNTEFYLYEHQTSQTRLIRNFGRYSVPAELRGAIRVVSGVADFPVERSFMHKIHRRKSGSSPGSTAFVVPWSISAMYNVQPQYYTTTNPANTQSVVEFNNYSAYNPSDLDTYCADMGISCPQQSNINVVGQFSYSPSAGGESTLDVEVMFSLSSTATSYYWTDKAWMYDFAVNLYNQAQTGPVPLVVSMSWGWVDTDQCDVGECSLYGMTNAQYVSATNTQFQKLGALGITLLAGAGDTGAPGQLNPNCTTSTLYPVFPGGSPYVTSVGATMLTSVPDWNPADPLAQYAPGACGDGSIVCANGTAEVVCSYPTALITSGGGFSSLSPQPSYQQAAVSGWLASGATRPPSTMFNANNRGYPDVSMIGHNWLVMLNGQWTQMDGTSASTPAFAALVVHLNDWAMNNGYKSLGFINPLLYQMWAAGVGFRDITSGNNACTETACCPWGYGAAVGWDPVTGLGVPNFGQMMAYVQSTLLARPKTA